MLKRFAVLLALGTGCAAVAHAATITGAFAATGADSYTTNTITFIGTSAGGGLGTVDGTVTAQTPTGTFLTYLGANGGESVTYFPAFPTSTPLPYTNGPNSVPAGIIPAGQTGVELFTVSGGGETFNFYMTNYNATYTAGTAACPISCLAVTGDGYYTGSGAIAFTNTNGQFTFTSQYLPNQGLVTSFSASTDATNTPTVPEPASIALVGSSLLGFAGLVRRKFVNV